MGLGFSRVLRHPRGRLGLQLLCCRLCCRLAFPGLQTACAVGCAAAIPILHPSAHGLPQDSKMTISRLLKDKEGMRKLGAFKKNKDRLTLPTCPEGDVATFTWFKMMQEKKICLSNDLVHMFKLLT